MSAKLDPYVSHTETRRTGLALMAILFVLPFLVFAPEAAGRRFFYYFDVQYYFLPYHELPASVLASHAFPGWNPFAFSGIPLFADGQTAMLYPPNWLFFLLEPLHALNLATLLQLSIGGMGAFLFARGLRLSAAACFLSGLVYMFNGFLVSRVVHLSIMSGAALIPWLFWAFERLMEMGSAKNLAIAATVVAMQVFSGHPQVPVYSILAAALYWFVVSAGDSRSMARAFALLAAAYVCGYALAAVQLLPWFEFGKLSPRAAAASFRFVFDMAIHPIHLVLLLFPLSFGAIVPGWLQPYASAVHPSEVWERTWYLGLAPLALAVFSLFRGTSMPPFLRRRWFALLALFICAVVFAAGDSTPFSRVFYHIPIVGRLRAVARAISLAGFAVAILAGIGLHLLNEPARRKVILPLLLSGLAVSGATWGMVLCFNAPPLRSFLGRAGRADSKALQFFLDYGLAWSVPAVKIAVLLAAILILLCLLAGTISGAARAAAFIAVTVADLVLFAVSFNPTSPPALLRHTPATVEFLRRDPDFFRIATFVRGSGLPVPDSRSRIAFSWGLTFRIEDINGFNSLQPRRYTDFLFGPEVSDVSYGVLDDFNLLRSSDAALRLLDVKYAILPSELGHEATSRDWIPVFENSGVTVFRNPRQPERAWFASSVQAHRPSEILRRVRMPGFDPAAVAYVEEQGFKLPMPNSGPASVSVDRPAYDHLVLRTRSDAERFLVLSEMWFPGWRAESDAGGIPIHRTDYLLRGLVVPAGEHTIHLLYRPEGLIAGAAISLATALALLLAVFSGNLLRRVPSRTDAKLRGPA